MSLRSRRFVRLLLPVVAVMCLSAAPQQQLNPTVKVLPAATGPVPTECEEGLAPQPQPRITPEEKAVAQEIAAAPELKAPPTKDLRATLAEVQAAAEGNDRNRFIDALARLKTMLATYPSGGERTAAGRAVEVYDDVDRLWTYQLTPGGAFFDATSDAYRIVSQYAGYEDFIRRQILTDRNGAKFYPTAESRAFLAQVAATRLKDFGIRSTTAASTPAVVPAVPAEKPAATSAAGKPPAERHVERPVAEQPKVRATEPAKKHPEVAPAAAGATGTTSRRKPAKSTAVAPAPKHRATTAAKSGVTKKPAAAPKTTETAPTTASTTKPIAAPTATAAPSTTKTAAQTPATSAAASTEPGETAAITSTQTTTAAPSTTAIATATSESAPAETTATAAAPEPTATTGTPAAPKENGKPNEPRNLLMPIILIVIGVGVLILLFRTSPGK